MTLTASERPVRWAIVGSSEFALEWVLPALQAASGAAPVAIVSRDPGRVRSRLRGDEPVVTARLEALPGLGVDVVHVITPNDLHLPLTLEALSLGLDVVVEKPMALSVPEALAMEEAANERGRLLAVGSCMAWSPVIEASRRIVDAGGIGAVSHASISTGFDASGLTGWRLTLTTDDGGGVLNDLGPHAVDALVRLLGPVESVSARVETTLPSLVADDTAALLLRHGSGATSFVHVSFTHACNDLRVTGSSGHLTSGEWLGRRFAGDLTWATADRGAAEFEAHEHPPAADLQALTATDVLQCQAEEVSAAIRAGVSPAHAAVADGLHVMQVLAASLRSARRGMTELVEDPPS
jgi:predicted dehydrogenase